MTENNEERGPHWPFESKEAQREWATNHFNSVEYYERRKDTVTKIEKFMSKYPTKEDYINRSQSDRDVEYDEFKERFPESADHFENMSAEEKVIHDQAMDAIWSQGDQYEAIIKPYTGYKRFVDEYEAGIRSRYNEDDGALEYYKPDGTIIRTWRKGDLHE